MTTWVHLSKRALTLAPHASATVTATVDVPKDASPGNQEGVSCAEQDSKGTGNVNLVSRVGIRMYLNIGPGGAPPAGFTVIVIGAPLIVRHRRAPSARHA